MLEQLAFASLLLGVVAGSLGTLVGAGGGFVLMPVLLLLYPQQAPAALTSLSLAVVAVNATSGTVAYARMRRVDYVSGALLATATVPGAVIGALQTRQLGRRLFNVVFAALFALASLLLVLRPLRSAERRGAIPPRPGWWIRRRVVDASGREYLYAYRPYVAVASSLVVGYVSSMLGIGGGVIHVPMMVYLLGVPVHIATATSQFAMTVMAIAGTATHGLAGAFAFSWSQFVTLAAGVIIGAQLGARWSQRLHARWIVRLLAAVLLIVALRLLWAAWSG